MTNFKNLLLAITALFLIFGFALNSLIGLEHSYQEPLIQFELVLFSDTDAEKIGVWCKDQDFAPKLITPEFGPRKIICIATQTSFFKVFGAGLTDKLYIPQKELPPSLKSVKWLSGRLSNG